MADDRTTRVIDCPECGETEAFVRLPIGASITDEESADGEVRATCLACGESFPSYYRRGD